VSLLAIILPFIALVLLVVALRLQLWLAGLAAFLLATCLWLLHPAVEWYQFPVPITRAFLVSCEISLILLGAISFLDFMQASGLTARIKDALMRWTAGEPLFLALLLAWLFCGFLEGAAGFGSPAAIVAPLLLSLGFPAVTAAILPLLGDSTAVPFGAVGTPVRIGFEFLPVDGVPTLAAGINLIAALVPVMAIFLLIRRNSVATDPTAAPRGGVLLTVLASFCFAIPAFVLSFLGAEFPSLLGSLAGLVIFMMLVGRRQHGSVFLQC
jgi:lactate permease